MKTVDVKLNERIVERAEQYATEKGKPLTLLIEEYLQSLQLNEISKEEKLTALNQIQGSVSLSNEKTAEEIIDEARLEKLSK